MQTINLDALVRGHHRVELKGTSYAVEQMSPYVAYIVDAAEQATGAEKLRLYGDALAELVPSMPRTEIDRLKPAQQLAIIDLAGKEVAIIEEAASDPNAQSPTSVASSGEHAPT